MESREKKRRHAEVKGPYYQYHYHLFQDEEFKRDTDELITYLKQKYPDLPGYDVDWLRMAGAEESDIQAIKDLAVKYQTSHTEVMRFATGFYTDDMPIDPVGWMGRADKDRNMIIMEYGVGITQQEYVRLWPAVAGLKRQLGADTKSRVRPPESTQLIYCVQKARRHGRTFPQIFKLYESGKLPGYTGSTTQHATSKLLENFYTKHRFTE